VSGSPAVVRVGAGKWKGRRLEAPPGARPTSGRARAALFDILGPERIAGSRVLDVFAGSGAVGLEAVSRGASAAVLVESDAAALARTCARLSNTPGELRVVAARAETALAGLAKARETFDLVFSDPPYGAGAEEVARAIDAAAGLLAETGVLVVQADAEQEVPTPRGLRETARRAYGRNVFHFFGIPGRSL
jgi:16S rRNA (guanine(966)-N(2))-methyltransferase RsmD